MKLSRHFYKSIFGISTEEVTFEKRGFIRSDIKIQQHLEQVGRTFLQGYHAALNDKTIAELESQLNQVDLLELRGFAYEGAAMGLTLLDTLTPWNKKRLKLFLESSGSTHIFMVHVGIGWVWARLNRKCEKALEQLDPLLGWLAIDGYGFHEGYFNWRQSVERKLIPKALSGYSCRVFDQGLGRSLWFVKGADIEQISATIADFASHRHADLWSGIGLACAYAGGLDSSGLKFLQKTAQSYLPQLAQGATFAAKARQRAGNPTAHTEMACQILCNMSAKNAAEITDKTLENLPYNQWETAYEIWRQRIQAYFALEEVTA